MWMKIGDHKNGKVVSNAFTGLPGVRDEQDRMVLLNFYMIGKLLF